MHRLPILLWQGLGRLCGSVLVAELIVLPGEASALLLQVLEVLILLGELPLQVSDLVDTASLLELLGVLAAGLGVTLVLLELGLESQGLHDLWVC